MIYNDQNIRISQPALAGSCGPWWPPGWSACPSTAHSPSADCQSSPWAPWKSPAALTHLFRLFDELQPPEIWQLPPVHMNPPSAGWLGSCSPRNPGSHHSSLGRNHPPLQPGQGSACHVKRWTPENDHTEHDFIQDNVNNVIYQKGFYEENRKNELVKMEETQ